MKLLIGLGNPGKDYERTRHNIGFLVVDELAKQLGGTFRNKRAVEAKLSGVTNEGESWLLCKPQTFMNASGRSVRSVMKQSNIKPSDLLIIYDDADLPFGELRIREGGSAGGHRGVQSILDQFPRGTSIPRLRIGIGRPPWPDKPLDEWVLERFTKDEEKELPTIIEQAIQKILTPIES